MNDEEYRGAYEGRIGSDRMTLKLAIIPDKDRGDMDEVARLRAALERITKCEGAPDIDATGECQTGLHCGVEDRDCQNAYQGADFGHAVGVEKALEWASNEAKHALEGKP